MKEPIYIAKNKKREKAADYGLLREEGIRHIQKLSSEIWTDYNVHDPGVTLLELLCYALTDLSYRTSLDLKDILAENTDDSYVPEFFTAREILTCNPTTINDLRRLAIDVKGVKNAWFEMKKDIKPRLYADCKASELTFSFNSNCKPVSIRGLYDVILELDEDDSLGDLNDYSSRIEIAGKTGTLNLPAWDVFLEDNIHPGQIQSQAFSYVFYDNKTRRYELELKITTKKEDVTEEWFYGSSFVSDERDPPTKAEVLAFLNGPEFQLEIARYKKRITAALDTVADVKSRLHAHRNLCEDYEHFKAVKIEKVKLCLDVEVAPDTNIEETLADIFLAVDAFLAPEVKFYSLEELLEEKLSVDEIFEGPALDHGFVKDKDLQNSELVSEVNISDLIQIIMDIEGVLAVKDLQLANIFQGIPLTKGERWYLDITDGRAPRLDIEISHKEINFYKGLIPYNAKYDLMKDHLWEKELNIRSRKLGYDKYDIEILPGDDLGIYRYQSVQEDLPLTYGVGKKGIPGIVDDKRLAQSKQLKAFLLIFDQLLVNYLAQLSNVRSIFSASDQVSRTYFYELLYHNGALKGQTVDEDTHHIFKLIREFTESYSGDIDDLRSSLLETEWSNFKDDTLNNFVKNLASITENRDTFLKRRNQFLDHLMARFAEQFTDYVLLSYNLEGEFTGRETLIEDKQSFLRDYPEISHDRGKAFNYTLASQLWNTGNVSGLTKRLCRLTGIDAYGRRDLSCMEAKKYFKLYKESGGWWFILPGPQGGHLLKSESYTSKAKRDKGVNAVLDYGIEAENYELFEVKDGESSIETEEPTSGDGFYFRLLAANHEEIGISSPFASTGERNQMLQYCIQLLQKPCSNEGFHLVEHILLRPKSSTDHLMPVCIDPGCVSCLGNLDPYSFRVTLVLPEWLERSRDMRFRRFFEHTARLETPAHIHVKICWVDKEDMKLFEGAWKDWLEVNAMTEPDEATRQLRLEKLINALNEIRSVYPPATLHDCDESEGENPLILGQSNLGSIKPKSS